MLSVRDVTVRYGDATVLDRVSVDVPTGTVTALLGPSGSGKSTLLRVIAGLVIADAGTVMWDGVDVSDVPTHRRNFGFVFQDEQLFPHKDVRANVEFGLRMDGVARVTRSARVADVLSLVGLEGFAARSVTTLSGGEAKRVALARALAPAPRLLLLDEPLTGLDVDLHDRLAADLRRLLADTRITALLVTHDEGEARQIAARVVHLTDLTAR